MSLLCNSTATHPQSAMHRNLQAFSELSGRFQRKLVVHLDLVPAPRGGSRGGFVTFILLCTQADVLPHCARTPQ